MRKLILTVLAVTASINVHAQATPTLTLLCPMPQGAGETFTALTYDTNGHYFVITNKNIYKCGN